MPARVDGSVLDTTAQALGIRTKADLAGGRPERIVGEDADKLIVKH